MLVKYIPAGYNFLGNFNIEEGEKIIQYVVL